MGSVKLFGRLQKKHIQIDLELLIQSLACIISESALSDGSSVIGMLYTILGYKYTTAALFTVFSDKYKMKWEYFRRKVSTIKVRFTPDDDFGCMFINDNMQ